MKTRWLHQALRRCAFACITALSLTTACCLTICYAEEGSTRPLRIGVLLSLSGDYAAYGVDLLKGIEVGVAELRQTTAATLLVEDIGTLDAKRSLSASQKLITIDKADLVFVFAIDDAKPIVSIFDRAKIPLIVLWDSNEIVKKGGPYLFSTGFSTEGNGRVIARFFVKWLHGLRLAVVDTPTSYSEMVIRSARAELSALGASISFLEQVTDQQPDFKSVITRLKNTRHDAVFLPLSLPQSAGLFVRQAKQLGLKSPLIGTEVFVDDAVRAAGAAADGVYVSWPLASSRAQLIPKLALRYPGIKIDPDVAAVGYDGIQILAPALRKSSSGGVMRDELEKVLGPTRCADREMTVTILQGGKLVALDEMNLH